MNRDWFFRVTTAFFLLAFAVSSYAQTPPPTTEVVYTGRLLGYFRVPSLQKFKDTGCPQTSPADSQAAINFFEKRNSDYSNAILVGTGDNFAPQLEARVLGEPPQTSPNVYAVGNKELYFGDKDKWVFYKNVKTGSSLETNIKNGLGTIPTDNVGCFLRAARYDAIVPGKHDFYFGAERVRQLARFLAGDATGNFKPVQMLGANLVLKTTSLNDKSIPARLKEKPWFTAKWSDAYPVQNLSDGATVYPWFSYVKIQIGKLPSNENPRQLLITEFEQQHAPIQKEKLKEMIDAAIKNLPQASNNPGEYSDEQREDDIKELNKLRNTTEGFQVKPIYICASNGNPNEIPSKATAVPNQLTLDTNQCNPPLVSGDIRLIGDTIVYAYPLKELDQGLNPHPNVTLKKPIGQGKAIGNSSIHHFSTLVTGKNYGLCNIKDDKSVVCLRFSVHTPFFYFPHYVPQQSADGYADPDPYVQVDDRAAVFGIVDPDLGSQVGILNFGWQHDADDELTSKVSVEDPVEALRQQLDYFERQHEKGFNGLKILLAQTNPQRAKALAAKFPEFQMVVSAADLDQATSEIDLDITWKPNGKLATFVGVPAPYFDANTRKSAVRFGRITAEKNENKKKEIESWKLTSTPTTPTPVAEEEDKATAFWDKVNKGLRDCLPSNFPPPTPTPTPTPSHPEAIKLLVLCTMRQQLGADVALIQSRDLFEKIPRINNQYKQNDEVKTVQRSLTITPSVSDKSVGDAQQLLDRLIWKGDLLTLLYVPGSALKRALEKSASYEAEEKSTLAFVTDRGRKLEKLGISKDSATQEYLINEVPIDDKKIYAVATTDFIGAGDTGYPDLAKAALNPRTHPAAFPDELVSISSLVCRKLYSQTADADCLGPIQSSAYLDKTVAAQIEPLTQPSTFKRFKEALPFKPPGKNPAPNSFGDAAEYKVQRRGVWLLSLKDLSFSFNSLDNNLSDSEVETKFGGNPTSSVQATQSKTWRFGADAKLLHSSHSRDFYIEPAVDFKQQATGDTPNKFKLSQISNRFFVDGGMVLWRRPGRPLPNVGLNLSLHTETQLQRPFSTFTLNNANRDLFKIYQQRSWLALPRLGLRWENRDNFAEFGIQAGREFNALLGYRFETIGGPVECLASSTRTFGKCISDNSKTADSITKDVPVTAMSQDRPRAGFYWKTNFSIPFGSRFKYTLDEAADFLFVNFRQDTSIDTRFRDISRHSLSVSIFPSISIGPTLRLFFYQNKVNRDFLIQKEFGIETKFSFDIFNRRETDVQFKYKPK